ncbi:ATP-dependent RNA helicase vasa-like [Drosophila eugracilis]|uniref:ATP-dependent RNA helicase vasa-like n=1 Tax=Drosophila eugracilis TaxID=29029 RepID=UPI0007E7B975|nr:ATP-dependent RNA helicase vasa-like [Drosophila eugracilis]
MLAIMARPLVEATEVDMAVKVVSTGSVAKVVTKNVVEVAMVSIDKTVKIGLRHVLAMMMLYDGKTSLDCVADSGAGNSDFNEARKFAFDSQLKISTVYGGISFKYQNEIISKGCHVLIATPGRLLDFVERFITFEDTRFVILDEADRMVDLGFRETCEHFMLHPMRPDHQTLIFLQHFHI